MAQTQTLFDDLLAAEQAGGVAAVFERLAESFAGRGGITSCSTRG